MVSAYHLRRHRRCRRFLFFARIFARVNYNKHAFIIASTTTTTTTVALTWARSRPGPTLQPVCIIVRIFAVRKNRRVNKNSVKLIVERGN